ncbi:uncharacterized protein LOC126904133 [Daktulosphaira vitifoliae]|uniref:uncharacterized protein LOC126904133 n=1 Tax=Daktulosphaira vitifoliae TaxID=58002 RepID=UPI0021AA7753|nr:uncharacterized protein LOC126904133 [Daktulosphaira vitifoliae]
MRKYQQLLLIIISLVSIFSLLTYRYEYMQLLNVIEVLNFFGYPANDLTNCTILNGTFLNDIENNNKLAKPMVSWTKIDEHFAYSAFWLQENESVYITVIGPKTAFSGYDCRVWYKLGDHYISSPGTFSYNLSSDSNKKINFYHYSIHCKPINVPIDAIPYGILLGRENSLKLFVPLRLQEESYHKDNLVICVSPDYSGIPDTNLVEFIAYHVMLGVKQFLVYDIGIHHQVLEFLNSIAGHKSMHNYKISTLSWQFPTIDKNLEKSVLLNDCIMRTQGETKHQILLSWEQYLVFNKDSNFNFLDQENTNYAFEVMKCCTKRLTKKSWPLAMRKTLCEKTNETNNIDSVNRLKISNFPTILGSIHNLEEFCNKTMGKEDVSMTKYLNSFMNSKLLNLWKTHVQFSMINLRKSKQLP